MGGYQVVIEDLDAAADELKELRTAVNGTSLEAPLAAIPGALPGSTSGPAATTLASTWKKRVASWVKDTGTHRADYVSAAETYRLADLGAEARSRRVSRMLKEEHA